MKIESGKWGMPLSMAAVGISCVTTQLVLMREMLACLGGNEVVLGIILGNWFLLTGLGCLLGRWESRKTTDRQHRNFLHAQLLVALLPPLQLLAVRGLKNRVFLPGVTPDVLETLIAVALVLLPFCLAAGFMLTSASAIGDEKTGESKIQTVYLADSVGSIIGGLIFSLVLVRFFDHFALLCLPALLHLTLGIWLESYSRSITPGIVIRFLLGALLAGLSLWNMDRISTGWQYPGQAVLFRGSSPYGRIVVTEYAGQANFFVNGSPLFDAGNYEHVEETAHYAMAQRPEGKRVLLISGGLSGTAREILRYGVREVVYIEMDPYLVEIGRKYFPANLSDPRIRIVSGDARRYLQRQQERFDVIIMDLPEPSTAALNRFFTREFFLLAKGALNPGGVLSFAHSKYNNVVGEDLARMLSSTWRALRQAFPNILVIPGGRIFFVASDNAVSLNIPALLKRAVMPTRFVNENYLRAALAKDRMDDMRRALSVPALQNTDAQPVLYHYHLRHWLSQFRFRSGATGTVLAALAVVCLIRFKKIPKTIFICGFAGATLQCMLLLVYQSLCGALYHEIGLLVTAFMAGLAAGALCPRYSRRIRDESAFLLLIVGLGAMAFFFPLVLMLLTQSAFGAATAKVVLFMICFLTAGIIGATFLYGARLCNRDEPVAAQLFSADFLGASLGAVIAGCLLIPIAGLTFVSMGVALLCLACIFILKIK